MDRKTVNPFMKMWKHERKMDDDSFDTNFKTNRTKLSFPDDDPSTGNLWSIFRPSWKS